MVMTDPLADMLTRIRNANLAYKDDVILPASTLKERVAHILAQEGYVASSAVDVEGKERALHMRLKYGPKRERTFTGMLRVSKPGKRVYANREYIRRLLGGLVFGILSTFKVVG